MLQIVIALSAAGVIALESRVGRAFGSRAWTAFRLMLGFAVAAVVYFGVLFVLVRTYSVGQPLGAVVYGAGFVLATLLGVIAGTLVSPAGLVRVIVPGTCVLAVMFPIGVNVYFGLRANWRPVYLLYLLGSIWGGYVIAWLMSGPRGISRMGRT
jgi:hypothetical protein